jgi:hypothetical protein
MKANKSLAYDAKDDAEEQVLVRNTATNQFVAGKNFYRQGNNWVDADFKPEARMSEINIKFGSDEYFALAAKEKGIGQYLAIGEEVVFVWKNRVYRITR